MVRQKNKIQSVKHVALAALTLFSSAVAFAETESSALFRARSGDFSVGTMRSVSIPAPAGWRRVNAINKDPLSLAQWTPREPMCATGAASRLSLYAVDVGKMGPHKLMQKWFPDALKFNVSEQERGFVIVRAEAEANRTQAVIAYPLSDEHITPLAGAITGVNVLLIAESTSQTAEELEKVVRTAIRSQIPARAANAKAMDVPFVLFNTQWHKTLGDRLEEASKRGEPNAMISKAYSMFNEADGFIPAGQQLLYKAAEKGYALARLDLIRLSRRRLLTLDITETTLNGWSKELAKSGSDDARFWATESRHFSEVDGKMKSLEDLKKLSSCGQPEARRTWAKHLVQSFRASERFTGRNIVMGLMRLPPLEGTLPITTRVPRAVEAPAIEQLKAAALLKTACPNLDDPEQELFAQAEDFKLDKKTDLMPEKFSDNDSDEASTDDTEKVKVVATPVVAEEFAELKEARTLDKMVNSGSMKTLKEAQKLACKWSGGDQDRNNLVIEIAARHNDGFGKWRRFRACDIVKENNIATVCRDQEFRQARTNTEARYRDILVTSEPELRNAIASLRNKAAAFHDALLAPSYAVAKTVADKLELDRSRRQMEVEFLDLVAASVKQDLQNQIRDVITGRKLLLLPPSEDEATFTLKRQPASPTFMKKELVRLEARMKETMQSIEEADKEDLSKDFKKGLLSAHDAWKAYRDSFAVLAGKLAEQGSGGASVQAAADLWFHIEGIYYFEQLRDHEINRSDVPAELERVPASYQQSYED